MPEPESTSTKSSGGGLAKKYKGLPLYVWYGGAATVGAVAFIFYKRYKAAKSTAAGASVGGQQPLYPNYADQGGFGGGGDSGGGSSGGGGGSTDPATAPVAVNPAPPTALNPGFSGFPIDTGGLNPGGPLQNLAAILPPSPGIAPVASPGSPDFAVTVPNTVPNDTSTVVQGSTGGNPFVFGGAPSEATNIENQLGQMKLPAPTGVGNQYTDPNGFKFTYG